MTEYQLLALQYADSLVTYAELDAHCKTSTLREDQLAFRAARDAMYDLQNALYAAAVAQVK